jgi:protein arginine kinase activator
MTCSQCQEREAVMELTQVANGQVTRVHLCEQCAAERGLENAASLGKSPLASYIAAMGQGINAPVPGGAGEPVFRCGSCGATLQDFRESGRLGCPDCYRALGDPLRELLRRLHGATRHCGERYAVPGGKTVEAEGRSSLELREQLKRAIESEDFERAAQLRDQLKVVE